MRRGDPRELGGKLLSRDERPRPFARARAEPASRDEDEPLVRQGVDGVDEDVRVRVADPVETRPLDRLELGFAVCLDQLRGRGAREDGGHVALVHEVRELGVLLVEVDGLRVDERAPRFVGGGGWTRGERPRALETRRREPAVDDAQVETRLRVVLEEQRARVDDPIEGRARDAPEDRCAVHEDEERGSRREDDPRGLVLDPDALRLPLRLQRGQAALEPLEVHGLELIGEVRAEDGEPRVRLVRRRREGRARDRELLE